MFVHRCLTLIWSLIDWWKRWKWCDPKLFMASFDRIPIRCEDDNYSNQIDQLKIYSLRYLFTLTRMKTSSMNRCSRDKRQEIHFYSINDQQEQMKWKSQKPNLNRRVISRMFVTYWFSLQLFIIIVMTKMWIKTMLMTMGDSSLVLFCLDSFLFQRKHFFCSDRWFRCGSFRLTWGKSLMSWCTRPINRQIFPHGIHFFFFSLLFFIDSIQSDWWISSSSLSSLFSQENFHPIRLVRTKKEEKREEKRKEKMVCCCNVIFRKNKKMFRSDWVGDGGGDGEKWMWLLRNPMHECLIWKDKEWCQLTTNLSISIWIWFWNSKQLSQLSMSFPMNIFYLHSPRPAERSTWQKNNSLDWIQWAERERMRKGKGEEFECVMNELIRWNDSTRKNITFDQSLLIDSTLKSIVFCLFSSCSRRFSLKEISFNDQLVQIHHQRGFDYKGEWRRRELFNSGEIEKKRKKKMKWLDDDGMMKRKWLDPSTNEWIASMSKQEMSHHSTFDQQMSQVDRRKKRKAKDSFEFSFAFVKRKRNDYLQKINRNNEDEERLFTIVVDEL